MTTSIPTLDDMALEIADYYGVEQQEILARYRRGGQATTDFVKWVYITEDEWDRRGDSRRPTGRQSRTSTKPPRTTCLS